MHPVTPDGRYFVVQGQLWRCATHDEGEHGHHCNT